MTTTPWDEAGDLVRQHDDETAAWRDEARAAEDEAGWDYFREHNRP